MASCIVSGTDTGIGKTLCAAMLTLGLDGCYWKPLQSGTEDGTDSMRVRELTGLPPERFFPEAHVLSQPLSPHRASELDGVTIEPERIVPPTTERTLLIEGAGGLLVPVTRKLLQIDLFKRWNLPVILCARTGLGTINHTLLSVEALKSRNMKIHGLIFIGPDNPDNMRTIAEFSGCKILGHIPPLDVINAETLARVFRAGFRREDF